MTKMAIKTPVLGPGDVCMLRELRDVFRVTQSALIRQAISVAWVVSLGGGVRGPHLVVGAGTMQQEEINVFPGWCELEDGKHPAKICVKLTPLAEEKLLATAEMTGASLSGVVRAGIRLLYFFYHKQEQGVSVSGITLSDSVLVNLLLPT